MKKEIVLSLVALAGLCSAQAVALPPETEAMRVKTGGRFSVPDTQKGEIVIVNCAKADRAWLEEVAAYFRKETLLAVRVADAGAFEFPSPKLVGNASIFVIDDAKQPVLLVAPENRWAMMNVASLKSDKPAFCEARVKKELVRAFALLCGGANSQYPNALTGGLASTGDLDKFVDNRLPVDVMSRFVPYLNAWGITPQRITTYLSACVHGVATPPTNKYQKAIWDKVHAIPQKPIKIEYNEKRDAGK